jgi:hypothetical protein
LENPGLEFVDSLHLIDEEPVFTGFGTAVRDDVGLFLLDDLNHVSGGERMQKRLVVTSSAFG